MAGCDNDHRDASSIPRYFRGPLCYQHVCTHEVGGTGTGKTKVPQSYLPMLAPRRRRGLARPGWAVPAPACPCHNIGTAIRHGGEVTPGTTALRPTTQQLHPTLVCYVCMVVAPGGYDLRESQKRALPVSSVYALPSGKINSARSLGVPAPDVSHCRPKKKRSCDPHGRSTLGRAAPFQ